MAGAAGGFVTRAFESMLKECSAKKYSTLQLAIQTYLGWYYEITHNPQIYNILKVFFTINTVITTVIMDRKGKYIALVFPFLCSLLIFLDFHEFSRFIIA